MSRYLVNLKKGNDYLVPSAFGGIDTSNLLATLGANNQTYTATQDCYIVFWYNVGSKFYINGVLTNGSDNNANVTIIPLSKGNTFSKTTNYTYANIYGVKY